MLPFEVELALNELAEEKKKWAVAYQDFRRGYEHVLNRLIHEAIAARMSVEQIAKAVHMMRSEVRMHMRRNGLNPKNGRSVLANSAAEALRTNAELLGVDPLDMDLTSPLAYLPAGKQLQKRMQSEAVQGVKELDEDGLTAEGRWLRERAQMGNEYMDPWTFVPCARIHGVDGLMCIRPDGHR